MTKAQFCEEYANRLEPLGCQCEKSTAGCDWHTAYASCAEQWDADHELVIEMGV